MARLRAEWTVRDPESEADRKVELLQECQVDELGVRR
jgi:hypothetical protein